MKNERLEKTQPNSQVWSCGESVCCPELVLWRGQGEARNCKSRLISTRTENEHHQFCWPQAACIWPRSIPVQLPKLICKVKQTGAQIK